MAKRLLWGIIIFSSVAMIVLNFNNTDPGLYPRIVVMGSLGVLALCESIEKR